jgi:DNA primase
MLKALTGKSNQEIEDLVNGLVNVDVLDLPEFEEFDSRENVVRHISKEEIKRRLVVPSGYYLNRGFSAQVLEEFCIGDCFSDKRMRNRAVVPVFDINGDYIGCSGRSHSDKPYINKWIHSKGLVTSATFYGIDKNAESVKSSKTVILVEGPGDLVKLYQYGITIALCPFGTKLTAKQSKLLTGLGVETILMGFDNDEAGIKATKKIVGRYSDRFKIVNLDLKSDPDEMSQGDWNKILQEYI